MTSLRKRIEKSPLLAKSVGTLMGWYVRLCIATSTWDSHGVADLEADLAKGSVLVACWHGRLMMIGPHWPQAAGGLSCLHNTAPIARAAGALQAHFGLDPFEMSARRSNLAASREIMKRARAGVSIGITADGPKGPGFVLKDAPLEWMRTIQRPVYVYAFATKRRWVLKSWDKMVVPLPFTRGAFVFRKVDVAVPRTYTPAQMEAARTAMQDGLNAVTAEADRLAG